MTRRRRRTGATSIGSSAGQPTPDSSRVSIVTPALAQRDYLVGLFASIDAQTYADVEHIVVDGGSSDGTVELLRSRERETAPFTWISETDSGMYAAINKGLALATGDILGYLNADDRYLPWTIEEAVQAFSRWPDVDLVYGDMLNVAADGTIRLLFYPPPDAGYLARYGFLGQPTVFWRRRLYERLGGFDESLRYVADCDYWLRAIRLGRAVKLQEVLAIERDHPGTQRVRHAAAVADELVRVRTRHVDLAPASRWRAVVARARAYLARRVALAAFQLAARRDVPNRWRGFLSFYPRQDRPRASFATTFLPGRGTLVLTNLTADRLPTG